MSDHSTTTQGQAAPAAPWLSGASASSRARGVPSVLILTKDEETNIAECIRSASFSDDIVVLDSFSTDRTVEIARSFPNVRVVQRVFDTEYKQRNYGFEEITYKHPWVYICDADERIPDDLRDEILGVAGTPLAQQPHAAYRMRYKNFFLGRWIKRSSGYPVWVIRLVRPELVRYEKRATNVHPIVQGTTGSLRAHFHHYSFSSGLKRWFLKHNFYSDREALEAVAVRRQGMLKAGTLWSADPMVRRRTLKNLAFFLKVRALWRFIFHYALRLGFLDGAAGLHYCAMISMYEYWIEMKIIEQEHQWRKKTERVVSRRLAEPAPSEPSRLGEPTDPAPLVDVFIPTFNEAAHISETVRNARLLGDVYVLDSLSTDGTQELARAAGATVVEHPFENYSRQKNWGLDNLPFKGEWVFILDADERITPALRDEALRLARDPRACTGYYVNRVVIFMGREIRHGGLYPSWNLRFFKRGTCRYEDRAVHEHMVCNGPTGYLRDEMLHIRRESISDYIAKHVRYADMESDEWVRARSGQGGAAKAQSLFPSLQGYRQWLRREAWPRMPFKPLMRFFYMYIVRLGLLDGRPGLHLGLLMASYEYMISLLYKDKMHTLRGRGPASTRPAAPSSHAAATPPSAPAPPSPATPPPPPTPAGR